VSLSIGEQYDKIYKYCFFKLKNARLAEDLTQETFLRFFSRNDYINIKHGKPLAYLYTIAKNLCIDSYRQTKNNEIELTEETEDTGATAEFESLETSLAVKSAVKTLADDVQEIILLRFSNDLSMAEISRITGLSRFAVRRKINNALDRLKQLLRKEDFQ
jgi:RNA polymerase sigma-70 factor (ECF subfamily)